MRQTGEHNRSYAVRSVVKELERCTGGRALAGQLEERLAARGISRRQARRWMGWAATGLGAPVIKADKCADGTWYSLRQATAWGSGTAAGLPDVPIEFRRDVALLVHALAQLGGEAESRAIARHIAAATDRNIVWATAAVDVARQAGRAAVAEAKVRSEWPSLVLRPGFQPAAFAAWLETHRFSLPDDHQALDAAVQARLGNGVGLGAGEADLVAALARVGGSATPEELAEQPFRDRRRAVAALLRLRTAPPPWAVWESGKRRVRLAAPLWQ